MKNTNTKIQRISASIDRFITALGRFVIGKVRTLGKVGFLFADSLTCLFKPPFRYRLYFEQMEFIGNKSLTVVLLTSFAVGAILTLQLSDTLKAFGSEAMVGGIVGVVLATEMSPLLGSLMINGRVASAIAAEIGTMKVTEQIEALESMSVDPVQYLIAPRVVAGIIILPFMTMIFNIVGITASYIVGVFLLGLDHGVFVAKISDFVEVEEIIKGLVKSSAFGFLLTFTGCYQGYHTSGGAKGVGVSTTQAVVIGSVLIMVCDYFIGAFLLAV